ncbi:MAG: GIY-YIG nuclease family protein [Leptolyngbyaceae cyanobacterium MO_188.B28]|nr:GIY-YIG nuclease family protein [Leptolyngbyaceae cyanobacterium MO_188.B28]
MATDQDLPIEHQNVPAAHQGLHDFLYGAGVDEHAVEATTTAAPASDGDHVMSIDDWQAETGNRKLAGVYAVLDRDRVPQYISYSRNVALSLESHVTQQGPEVCAFVRVQAFKFPKRTEMEALCAAWIAELENPPSGNLDGGGQWAKTVGEAARAAMSDAERQAYEEKKLKLRKAMADNTLSQEKTPLSAEEVNRRQKLEAAVTNDDWSAVIRDASGE